MICHECDYRHIRRYGRPERTMDMCRRHGLKPCADPSGIGVICGGSGLRRKGAGPVVAPQGTDQSTHPAPFPPYLVPLAGGNVA